MTDPRTLQEENMAKVIEDGPRLRTDYNVWVEARADGRVLLGGLGAMGVGTMWMDEEPRHRDYPGYDEAPVDAGIRDGMGEAADGSGIGLGKSRRREE